MKIKTTYVLKDLKIKWEGVTDFSELYKYMKLHLEDMGYGNEKTLEKKYIKRITAGGEQLEIAWHATKKKSEFFVFNIDTTILILGMTDTEVQEGDVKRKMKKGVFEARIDAYLTSTERWDELGGLQKLYQEMFIRKRMNTYLEELYSKATSYHSFIKTFLGLRD